MEIFRGTKEFGNWQNAKLVLDFDKLFFYRGGMAARASLDSTLGNLLFVLGLGLISASITVALLSGELINLAEVFFASAYGLLFWLGLLLFVYANYLKRDRSVFSFEVTAENLFDLQKRVGKPKFDRVNLESYLAYSVWQEVDRIYFENPQAFLKELAKMLANNRRVQSLFSRLGLKYEQISQIIESTGFVNTRFDAHIGLFSHAFLKAIDLGAEKIDEVVLCMCLIEGLWVDKLRQFGVQATEISGLNLWLKNSSKKSRYRRLWEEKSLLKPVDGMNRAYTSRYAPTIKTFCEDYTAKAALGSFVVSTGKEEQMREILKVLQKDTGAATILLGEPGVGKSVFLKHLATRMVVEDVPQVLRDKRLVAFEHNRTFTKAQSFEEYKKILQDVFNETAASKDVLLILDNLDQMLDVRKDYQAELLNVIIGAIDKYNLPIIATASITGYNKFIKPIAALSAALSAVTLPEPKAEVSLQILIDESERIEKKYGISVQVPAIKQIVNLAPKFAYERVMPDKGVDLLEEAILEAKDLGLNTLTEDVVNGLISLKVGVNVGRISESEAEVLNKLEVRMHGRVVGQEQAIAAVANALRRARAGLQKSGKPIASFLFFGPTGVGKTEVSKTLAESYYGDEKTMIRIDMSEYQEEVNLGRLIGQMEGERLIGGYLTEAVRQKPFSLVLFDEIEKANPKVLDLFLQMLDEGYITDGAGRKIDFSNTIIIATTNAGSADIAREISANQKYEQVYLVAQEALKRVFRVEFLNRFSKIVMFKPLNMLEVEQIATLMLERLDKQLQTQGYALEYTREAVQNLVKIGFDPIYGARQMQRVIQEQVEDRIAQAVVTGSLKPGGVFRL